MCASTRRVIKQYRQKASIESEVLFRQIRRGDHVQSNGLTDFSARRIIQKQLIDAGVEGFTSGHSLRVHSVLSFAQAGRQLWICKLRASGGRRRCQHIMLKPN